MIPIGNKILTTPIQTTDGLSETSQASGAHQNPKAATGDSIGKAMSNFDLIKAGSVQAPESHRAGLEQGVANKQKELQELQKELQGTQDAGFFGQVGSFFGSDEGAGDDLQSQDKMGNFEIQGLMSDFNQAETLLSSVEKKKDDSDDGKFRKLA